MTARRHRRARRPSRSAPFALGVAVVIVLGLALFRAATVAEPGGATSATPAFAAPTPEAPAEPAAATPAFAAFSEAGGVTLHLPAESVVTVMFHEASSKDAMAHRPVGTCAKSENRTKFRCPLDSAPVPTYTVMSSRGRGTAATSAADVVVPPGEPLFAPGTVVAVKRYLLYDRHPDIRVAIRPDGPDPRIRVVVIHLRDVRLVPGQRVEASVTPLGIARAFRFRSQVDDYLSGGRPHVHVEVKRVG